MSTTSLSGLFSEFDDSASDKAPEPKAPRIDNGMDSFVASADQLSRNLVARAQKGGSESVWMHINQRYEAALRVYANYTLGHALRRSHTADDLIQEAWIRVLPSFDKFEYRGPGCLRRWLTLTIRRIAAEWARGPVKRREKEVSLDSSFDPSDGGESPSQLLEEQEAVVRLVLSLENKQLTQTYRDILIAHCFEGRSLGEIAAEKEMKVDTIRKQLHRAKGRWREILGDDPDRLL